MGRRPPLVVILGRGRRVEHLELDELLVQGPFGVRAGLGVVSVATGADPPILTGASRARLLSGAAHRSGNRSRRRRIFNVGDVRLLGFPRAHLLLGVRFPLHVLSLDLGLRLPGPTGSDRVDEPPAVLPVQKNKVKKRCRNDFGLWGWTRCDGG